MKIVVEGMTLEFNDPAQLERAVIRYRREAKEWEEFEKNAPESVFCNRVADQLEQIAQKENNK